MSVLHPRRAAEADRSRIRSYDQVRAMAVGRPQMGVLGLGDDRGRAVGCGDITRRGGGTMRRRPATGTPRPADTAGARRQVVIATVRATEPQASLEENLALLTAALAGPAAHLVRMVLMPHAARIAELAGERRRITAAVTL